MARRSLQVTLTTIGTVAMVAGLNSVARGARGVLGSEPVSANVDSELRFYASWYVVLGALILNAARRPESETLMVRACATGFLVAAFGRVLSTRSLGKPHPFFRGLMCIEFAIPVIIPWQNHVARASAPETAARVP